MRTDVFVYTTLLDPRAQPLIEALGQEYESRYGDVMRAESEVPEIHRYPADHAFFNEQRPEVFDAACAQLAAKLAAATLLWAAAICSRRLPLAEQGTCGGFPTLRGRCDRTHCARFPETDELFNLRASCDIDGQSREAAGL